MTPAFLHEKSRTMLKIIRWRRLVGFDPMYCERPELFAYTITGDEYHGPGCNEEVDLKCQTDNGSWFKVCPECARRLGYRDANGR